MVLNNNQNPNKRPIRFILVGLLVFIITGFVYYTFLKKSQSVIPELNSQAEIKNHLKDDHAKDMDNKEESTTSLNQSESICLEIKNKFKNVNEVKSQNQTSIRYQNLHKTIDGITYRLRFFYKDSSEGERLQYLVYKENSQEEDILVETTPYKKGKLYSKIENALGEIIYFEEAITVGKNESPYLVYINGQLSHIQENAIDCRF